MARDMSPELLTSGALSPKFVSGIPQVPTVQTKPESEPAMRRITRQEQREWKARLEQPMSPAEMRRIWNECKAIIGSQMLVQSGVEFLRDAFVAHRFAGAVGALSVRLIAEPRPDFATGIVNRCHRFEVTEADWRDRKRSDEYKFKHIPEQVSGTAKVEYAPELFSMKADQAFEMVNRVATEKCDGRYEKTDGLVVYLQPGSWSDERRAVEATLPRATEIAREHFEEVWVLWGTRLYLLWQFGRRCLLNSPFRVPAHWSYDDGDDD